MGAPTDYLLILAGIQPADFAANKPLCLVPFGLGANSSAP